MLALDRRLMRIDTGPSLDFPSTFRLLYEYKVSTEHWGEEGNKSIGALGLERWLREARLVPYAACDIPSMDGMDIPLQPVMLVREVDRVCLRVTHTDKQGNIWLLWDALQDRTNEDGSHTIVKRKRPYLGEKMIEGEALIPAAMRALDEESGGGIIPSLQEVAYTVGAKTEEWSMSDNYPKLPTRKFNTWITYEATEEDFARAVALPSPPCKPGWMGYIENQENKGKIAYARWKLVGHV